MAHELSRALSRTGPGLKHTPLPKKSAGLVKRIFIGKGAC